MSKTDRKNSSVKKVNPYSQFAKLNGEHPLQKAVSDSYVPYKVRSKGGGKVLFFNFELAKIMGFIPDSHPDQLNDELVEHILNTFSVTIVNEYDQINKIPYPKKSIRENDYMATRYLQIQHASRVGKTSGDGRSVWNGAITHKGVSWDVSSCGTGATCLSPATSKFNKFFKTGDPSISYGCGCSEKDEGIGALFFSEIFHRNNLPTERVLAIIEYKNGLAINVRAHTNLLRPSHFFLHLKQNNLPSLKGMMDYYIDRQEESGVWENVPKTSSARYKFFLDQVMQTFSKMAAQFEDEYIFCWLDWDGDNILMDGGIIDYGSVRQFGLYHSEYRYDDVERFSTSITEQKKKSRYIVQGFAQVVDYILSGTKKNIKDFSKDKVLKKFDESFEYWKNRNLLQKIGFSDKQIFSLVKNDFSKVTEFRKVFSYFERTKSKKGKRKVEDGISWDAIFCMRDILRELPQLLLSRMEKQLFHLSNDEFIGILKSNYATAEDMVHHSYRNRKIQEFQELYIELLLIVSNRDKIAISRLLLETSMRSSVINKYDRVTGDSIGNIVDRVLNVKPRLAVEEIYQLMRDFSSYQHLDPQKKREKSSFSKKHKRIVRDMVEIVKYFREGL